MNKFVSQLIKSACPLVHKL